MHKDVVKRKMTGSGARKEETCWEDIKSEFLKVSF